MADAAQLQATGTSGRDDVPKHRRHVFVQLLFSLVAAEISREAIELITRGYGPVQALPAYSHLVLAAAVVVTSWIGWTGSTSSRAITDVSVFSVGFLVLVVDVLLVFLYFLLTRGVEMPPVKPAGQPLPGVISSADVLPEVIPSASNEARTIALIFFFYFVWDVLTKAISKAPGAADSIAARLVTGPMLERGWSSLLCMVFGIVAWLLFQPLRTYWGVVCADVSLLSLVFFFRALKENQGSVVACPLFFVAFATGVLALLTEWAAKPPTG